MKVEKIAICLAIIAVVMKFMQWNGAGILLTVAAIVLSFLYLVFSFLLFRSKESSRKQTILSVITGLILSIAPLAVLFKLQYWPGARVMLVEYVAASAILILIVLVLKQKQEEELALYYRRLPVRLISYSVICLVLFLIPSKTLLHIQYWNDPEFAKTAADFYEHPENEEYRKKYMERQEK